MQTLIDHSNEVVNWFRSLDEKKKCTFIQMDIKEFYPSISEEILNKAIIYAQRYITIKQEDLDIIKHSRQSLLYDDNVTPWIKKEGSGSFDVTMGSHDGAEICEFVGLYILAELSTVLTRSEVGLYRDDGLAVARNMNPQQTDRLRKKIIKIFHEIGFDIEISINLKVVDFLDITFDLNHEIYKPYKKPNDKLMYINTASNHPPQIIKQIPLSISKRLSDNSSNENIFNDAKSEYQKALKENGYTSELQYVPKHQEKRNRIRKRNIIWFNPPFSKNVETNIAKRFLQLIDKHFPSSNPLHKIFNRNTLKVSYSTTENMKQIVNKHNKQIIMKKDSTPMVSKCNCRIQDNCPLDGVNCQKSNVVYKGEVSTTSSPNKTYIGITEGPWKARHAVHKTSFKDRMYPSRTALTDYVWRKKEQEHELPTIKWTIEKTVPAYNNVSKRCLLCLEEKISIIEFPEPENLLNKRSELVNKCLHQNKFLLKNYKNKRKDTTDVI